MKIILFSILIILLPASVNAEEYGEKLIMKLDIDEIFSHLQSAQANYDLDRKTMAMSHIDHADNKIHEKLNADYLFNEDYLENLAMSVHLIKNINHDSNKSDYSIQINAVEKILGNVVSLYIGNNLVNDQKFQKQSIVNLLEKSMKEYDEGLEIDLPFESNIELQDAFSLTKQARSILNESNMDKGVNLDANFDKLLAAYRGGVLHFTDIDKLVNEIKSEIGNEKIPEWIKNTALWWATDQISDEEYLQSITYLIDNKIILETDKQHNTYFD